MKTWIKQFEFAAPHTMKYIVDAEKRLRIHRNLTKREIFSDSLFVWKYRVEKIHAVNFEVEDIDIIIVDENNNYDAIKLNEFMAKSTARAEHIHIYLHSEDRFLLTMLWGELVGKRLQRERMQKAVYEDPSKCKGTVSSIDFNRKKNDIL